MRKRWIWVVALLAYGAMLIRVVVFKALPVIRVGHRVFRFSGQQAGPPNLVPFRTIKLFLQIPSGHFLTVVNLAGNVAVFVPVGLLAPMVYQRMTWPAAMVLAVAVGLLMEGLEAWLRVGIFDVDDIILNALGVMIGYWMVNAFRRQTRDHLRAH